MDANKRAAIIERLAQLEAANDGRITAALVVDDARDPEAPYHSDFLWDDAAAGHQHRLDQARHLIRTVYYVHRTEKTEITTVRYVRDPAAEATDQGYVAIARLRTEADHARDALEAEMRRIQSLIGRAHGIAVSLGLEQEFRERLASMIPQRVARA